MEGEYQNKLKEATSVNIDTFSKNNVQIILAKCGALLHDVDDQLEKVEAGKLDLDLQIDVILNRAVRFFQASFYCDSVFKTGTAPNFCKNSNVH